MLYYSLAKHARFCDLFPTTFSTKSYIHFVFNFFVEELVKDNWGKTGGVLVS